MFFQDHPALNWTRFFSSAFSTINRTITKDQEIIVYAPKYLKKLTRFVEEKLSNEKTRLIVENYLLMHLVNGLRNALSEDYRDAGKGLEKALYGNYQLSKSV